MKNTYSEDELSLLMEMFLEPGGFIYLGQIERTIRYCLNEAPYKEYCKACLADGNGYIPLDEESYDTLSRFMLHSPLEKAPLYINCGEVIKRIVMWRLRIGH